MEYQIKNIFKEESIYVLRGITQLVKDTVLSYCKNETSTEEILNFFDINSQKVLEDISFPEEKTNNFITTIINKSEKLYAISYFPTEIHYNKEKKTTTNFIKININIELNFDEILAALCSQIDWQTTMKNLSINSRFAHKYRSLN